MSIFLQSKFMQGDPVIEENRRRNEETFAKMMGPENMAFLVSCRHELEFRSLSCFPAWDIYLRHHYNRPEKSDFVYALTDFLKEHEVTLDLFSRMLAVPGVETLSCVHVINLIDDSTRACEKQKEEIQKNQAMNDQQKREKIKDELLSVFIEIYRERFKWGLPETLSHLTR